MWIVVFILGLANMEKVDIALSTDKEAGPSYLLTIITV